MNKTIREMVEMLVWKDDYAVGVEIVDEQHKHMFEIGNRVYRLLKDDFCVDKYDKASEILDELKQYTRYHFETEEQYMLDSKNKGYFIQKVEHDKFLEKLDEFELGDLDEISDKDIEDLLTFIFEWVLDHILKKDKEMMSS